MNYAEWKNGLGKCCADIVQNYNELYSHIDKLADLPEMADQDTRDEASAFIVIKLRRMHTEVAEAALEKSNTADTGDSSIHGNNNPIDQTACG